MRYFFLFTLLLLKFFCSAQQLVLRGDYPDPSVVKIGNSYWASATTSNWAPAFPLLQSDDLVNWKLAAHAFPGLPEWADFYFWAPELSYDNGKVYLYYAAHKKGGNLCVGVASADRPEGPYRDHGPLMCQEVGSIDAFPMRDEKGKLHLIWKEDANSVGKPTSIWAMEMNEERTALTGEKKELFRNDVPWEGNLVEGVSMMRHGAYFYAFYAGAGCCGGGCTYATGIARSKSLLGPWEKFPNNPVLTKAGEWTCPGHGTPVEKNGRYYFLYHAYNRQSNVFTGREGMLIEFRFTPDKWIEMITSPSAVPVPLSDYRDDFKSKQPDPSWQWSVFRRPTFQLKSGRLYLDAHPNGSFIAQKTLSANYTATVRCKRSTAATGLALIGDEQNLVSVLHRNDSILVVQRKEGKETALAGRATGRLKKYQLRVDVRNGRDVRFFYSRKGHADIPLTEQPLNAAFLPPWDRAVRVGIIAEGKEGTKAVLDDFELNNE